MNKLKVFFILIITIFISGCATPKDIGFKNDLPIEVNQGEEFVFTITINNDDTKEREVRSIDISNKFLEGVAIVRTEPQVKQEYDAFGQRIFEFKSKMSQKSENKFIFTAKAVKVGDFSGDLDICIDGDSSCIFSKVRTIVK